MNTTPKARKFRIRRSPALGGDGPAVAGPTAVPPAPPPVPGPTPRPDASQQMPDNQVMMDLDIVAPQEETIDEQIDAIRREGLTGRQLRMARRVAQKHNIAFTSDFDAVRLLRAAGIDPFQRSTLLDLVIPSGANAPEQNEAKLSSCKALMQIATAKLPAHQANTLPQTANSHALVPGEEPSTAVQRAIEIREIQLDIARRRRRKLALLFTRLAFFVFLPTLICGWYFYTMATPMYATKSSFLVMKADAQGGGGLPSLLSGTQFATQQDSVAVQDYLQSRDAMLRLDRDMGFKAHFQQDFIDPIQRLDPDATDEAAYRIYKKNVKIGYDPTEGAVRMEVIAVDPTVSADFSRHLNDYAEERVDELSRKKRQDQLKDSIASLEAAKEERRLAQEVLIGLQEATMLDPQGEIASVRSLISTLEGQIIQKKLDLNTQLSNPRPNAAKVDSLRTELALLEAELGTQNRRLAEAAAGTDSLARKAADIQMAQADLATADMFMQSALQNLKQTELEANRQVRYLTTSVKPVAPDEPTYPRKFENTVLSFLVFAGIYLMFSLTSSILREQVST